ncbi:hypothetical protein D3C76_331890 [compost metagenome]
MNVNLGLRVGEIGDKAATEKTFLLELSNAPHFVRCEPVHSTLTSRPKKIAIIREIAKSVIPVTQTFQTSPIVPKAFQIVAHTALCLQQDIRQRSRIIQR